MERSLKLMSDFVQGEEESSVGGEINEIKSLVG